jgi:FlaA1/EpsC-like NDP-sugar epimerase
MKMICRGAKYSHVIRMVKRIMEKDNTFELLGFIDNDKTKWGKEFHSYPVFGGADIIPKINSKDIRFCNLITMDCKTRHETTLEMLKHGAKLGNIIDPSVDTSMTKIGKGVYIQEGVNIQADVIIGDNEVCM